jgi:hypothetical protein
MLDISCLFIQYKLRIRRVEFLLIGIQRNKTQSMVINEFNKSEGLVLYDAVNRNKVSIR